MNIVKDDGFTPLHLSAINNHIDVVTSFAEHVSYIGGIWLIIVLQCSYIIMRL